MSLNERYWISYNGEIYNHIEIRRELEKKGHVFQSRTDTEVILHAYLEWGEDCLHHFNGMFAFLLYDVEEEKLWAARDRFGVKPLLYVSSRWWSSSRIRDQTVYGPTLLESDS